MREPDPKAVEQLRGLGLLHEEGGALRTSSRFHAAMARAALRLLAAEAPDHDLRLPIAEALVELEGDGVSDEQLTRWIEVLLPIERVGLGAPDGQRS